jgi:hypothetical protein
VTARGLEGGIRRGRNQLFTMSRGAVCLDGNASSYGWMDALLIAEGAEKAGSGRLGRNFLPIRNIVYCQTEQCGFPSLQL